jgi:hypothetical protein
VTQAVHCRLVGVMAWGLAGWCSVYELHVRLTGARLRGSVIDQYIGTSPWQWLGDKTSLGLGTAMYDLMGKDAGVPVWQLFGQQARRWVPVGAWTVSAAPLHMAEAVQRYAARGYTWMKSVPPPVP